MKREILSFRLAFKNIKLQNQYLSVSNLNSRSFRNLDGEKNLPEHNIVHCLWIAVRVFLHSELDVVGAPHAAHRHVQLAVGEEGASVPQTHILESLS